MEKLIVRPLNESSVSTVIVIDALDECEDKQPVSAILSIIGRLVNEIPKVKFFLTGRPEPRVSEGFRLPQLAKMTDVFVLHQVEPGQVDGDIRLFFKNSFSELAGRRCGLNNWPTKEQLDLLCKRAAGLFVYAAAMVMSIDYHKGDSRKRLELLLQSQNICDREGKTLDSLYTSILQEVFGDDRPRDDTETRSVLGAVVLATSPLPLSAIATFLGLDFPSLLSSANSLLILQGAPNHPVWSFHESFPEPRDHTLVAAPSFSTHPFVRLPSIPPEPQIPLSFRDPELLWVSDATPSELNLSLYVFPPSYYSHALCVLKAIHSVVWRRCCI